MTTRSALVKDYMARTLVTFKPETDVLDAVHVLVKHRIAGAPVVDDEGNLLGMLSEYDCMKVALDSGYHVLIEGVLGGLVCAAVYHRALAGEASAVGATAA